MRETLPFNGLILTSYFGKVRAIKLGQTQSVDLSCSHNTNIIQFVSNDQQYQHLTWQKYSMQGRAEFFN